MKTLLLSFTLLLSLITHSQTGTQTIRTIVHDSKTREYILYVPSIYDGSVDVPLVLNLHGYTSNMIEQIVYGDFRKIADTANFILAVPNGLPDSSAGERHWNFFLPDGEDDLGFLSALIDEISANYSINTNRVYATGMSNGGYMSIHLACNLTAKITAVASVTGTMNPYSMASCFPTRAVPTMLIHGTNDASVPYDGSIISASVPDVIAHWVNQTNCNPAPLITQIPDLYTSDSCTVEHYLYTGGTNGATVELFKIIGGGHTWPGAPVDIGVTNQDIDASEEIWRFFSQFSIVDLVHTTQEEQPFEFVDIFPNPSTGSITVLPFQNIEVLELLTIEGKVIQRYENRKYEFQINNLNSGIYFVQIIQKGQISSQKIIVH